MPEFRADLDDLRPHGDAGDGPAAQGRFQCDPRGQAHKGDAQVGAVTHGSERPKSEAAPTR